MYNWLCMRKTRSKVHPWGRELVEWGQSQSPSQKETGVGSGTGIRNLLPWSIIHLFLFLSNQLLFLRLETCLSYQKSNKLLLNDIFLSNSLFSQPRFLFPLLISSHLLLIPKHDHNKTTTLTAHISTAPLPALSTVTNNPPSICQIQWTVFKSKSILLDIHRI